VARAKKDDEGLLSDEQQAPRAEDYDDEGERSKGDDLTERAVRDGKVDPVPDGGQFEGPDEREDRAEYLRNNPIEPLDTGRDTGEDGPGEPLSAQEAFAAKAARARKRTDEDTAPSQSGSRDSVEARLARLEQQAGVETPSRIVPATPGASGRQFFLVRKWSGRFEVYHAPSLEYARGRAQDMAGEKRLFELVPGQEKLLEVNGQGNPVNR
jgi:hypothetical protein